jgi:eukaryotic translation initiation factor 2C
MVRRTNFDGNSIVNKEFGIQVRDEHSLVDARVLPSPMVISGLCLFELFRQSYEQLNLLLSLLQLLYHNTGSEQTEQPRMGQWNMINKVR